MDEEPDITRFGPFLLDRTNRQLRREGNPIELGSRYFDALSLLVERRGELVTKDAFMEQVWRGIPVTDEALTQCIRSLRKALGDEAGAPRFIQTVPKHGYRFVAEVENSSPTDHLAGPANATASLPSRIAGSCTLAGLFVGALAGGFYGIVVGTGGGGHTLILAAMIGSLGLLAGAALGMGMAAALAWRGTPDAFLPLATAAAGLLVGALGSTLGREGIGLLTARRIGEVTGPLEGLLIGAASGVAAWVILAGRGRAVAMASALATGAVAGALIHLGGGTLLAGSLASLQQGLPDTQLAMERLGVLSGAEVFSAMAQGITAVVESAVFVAAIALAVLLARR